MACDSFMAETPGRSRLIAVDSNVLLDRANNDELVQDATETVRRRIRGAKFIVTPTVIEEIVLKAERGEKPLDRRLAKCVLANLANTWGFEPMSFIPVGRGIVVEIARRLRSEGIIPDQEINDSLIVAEAALAGATLLLSSDAHVKDIEFARLKFALDAADVETPLIASPWKVVHEFFHLRD